MYQFESKIRYSEVDADCNLTLSALMNYFQDCSSFQSEELGIGVQYLADHHMAWMLSFWQICINNLPRLTDHVSIQTWPYDMKAFYGYRNFSMNGQDGSRYAYANSVWVLIDTDSGRPVKVPERMLQAYVTDPQLEMACSERKIPIPEGMEIRGEMVVPSHFIDSNRHMNNEKYVVIALEYVPEDFQIGELRVEYKKEAKLGNKIIVSVRETGERFTIALNDEEGKPYAVVAFLQKN